MHQLLISSLHSYATYLTNEINNQSIIPSTNVIQLTLTLKMTTAQVVETSVTVNNNSPKQDYVQPDGQTQPAFEMTPRLKPFTVNVISFFSSFTKHSCPAFINCFTRFIFNESARTITAIIDISNNFVLSYGTAAFSFKIILSASKHTILIFVSGIVTDAIVKCHIVLSESAISIISQLNSTPIKIEGHIICMATINNFTTVATIIYFTTSTDVICCITR